MGRLILRTGRTTLAITDQTVDTVLSKWPSTVSVFLSYGLACVGCPLSRFQRISDVASAYQLDLETFVQKLRGAIEVAQGGHAPRAQA